MNDQKERAALVAEDLQENGHDVEPLDILDALATHGLVLMPATFISAVDAHLDTIQESTP